MNEVDLTKTDARFDVFDEFKLDNLEKKPNETPSDYKTRVQNKIYEIIDGLKQIDSTKATELDEYTKKIKLNQIEPALKL
jgi:hypothetical protein